MAHKCGACGKFISATDGVGCAPCGGLYHRGCLGLPERAHPPPNWTCPACSCNRKRDNREDTPVKGINSALMDQSMMDLSRAPLDDTAHDITAEMPYNLDDGASLNITAEFRESELAVELRQFRVEMQGMKETFQRLTDEVKDVRAALRQELHELKSAVGTCEARLDALEARMQVLAERPAGEGLDPGAAAVIRTLEESVTRLQLDLSDRDQELLQNDVELTCVPEESGENPAHLVVACAAKLGVTLDERDLVRCERVGARREEGARPRPIAVRLARRGTRADLLRAARVRRSTTTEGLGLASAPRAFYINERLTGANRRLFHRAREAGRQASWRFVWTRDGRIFARRDSGDPANRIRCDADLVKVFGTNYVRASLPAP